MEQAHTLLRRRRACSASLSSATNVAAPCRFLQEEFGKVPTVGWQVDPFGHSATQASLSALYGFDAQFFGRADYQVGALRMHTVERHPVPPLLPPDEPVE